MKYSLIKSWGGHSRLLVEESCTGLARGNGQSYGDSSIHSEVRSLAVNNFFVLDESMGILKAQCGAMMGEILAALLPKGWILPVIPGSSLVTVGGAIASDVHGKNHFSHGTFSQHVASFKLQIAGDIHTVFPGDALFMATCGGMGLTGTILEASLRLKKLNSSGWSKKNTVYDSLEELVKELERSTASYTNAWIDGCHLNRGVLTEIEESQLPATKFSINPPAVPWCFDVWNELSQNLFNSAYYYQKKIIPDLFPVKLARELFPLERSLSWNNLCGEKGVLQIHFVVPLADQMLQVFRTLAAQPVHPLLISMKKFGPSNGYPLSFPMEGLAVALDFKNTSEARALIQKLTDDILDFKGRVYLTKDSLLTEDQFKRMYPDWEKFQQIRLEWGAREKYGSQQSRRLGLD
jgi:FAD/FMN-containing dehydrogenase